MLTVIGKQRHFLLLLLTAQIPQALAHKSANIAGAAAFGADGGFVQISGSEVFLDQRLFLSLEG